MDEHAKMPRTLIDKLFELGVMGIEIPEAYGGAGATFFHAVLAVEALSRVDPSVGVLVDVQNTLVVNALLRWGSDDVEAALPAAARVERRSARMRCRRPARAATRSRSTTRAVDDAATAFVLTGRKLWITNGNEADLFIVFATIDPGGRLPRHHRVPRRARHRRASPSARRKTSSASARAAPASCIFEDCRVPAANVLGEVGKGYKVAIETLNEGRIGIGAQMVGLAQGALDHTDRATRRSASSSARPIAEFQGVQFQIARAATEVEAARLLVYNAARLRDAGQPFLTEAAMCKLFASEVAERVASLAVNLYGGYGFVKDYPVEKLYRDAKIGQIYEGTSNLQLQTIAKQIMS